MKHSLKSIVALGLMSSQAVMTSACSSSDEENGPLGLTVITADDASNGVTSTLIAADSEALLVDAQFTRSGATRVADEITKSGKKLKAIYITHAHPDHAFGLEILTKRFPDAQVLAAPEVVSELAATAEEKIAQWKPVYMDDLTDTPVSATPYDQPTFDLEGHEIRIIGPEQGDIEHTFTVFVPELKALITGDSAYNGTHVWLADAKLEGRKAWIETTKTQEALGPEIVVAGHKDASRPDSRQVLAETRAYIEDFNAAVAESATADEVQTKMLAKHEGLKFPAILQYSAQAAIAEKGE